MKLRKILAFVLAAAMLLCLAACKGKDTTTDKTATGTDVIPR